ncbi:hypothetical protein [Sporocytophaga myxococcoides]|nr:hypothetical protein [Sporocytophaga myxococcoides]
MNKLPLCVESIDAITLCDGINRYVPGRTKEQNAFNQYAKGFIH